MVWKRPICHQIPPLSFNREKQRFLEVKWLDHDTVWLITERKRRKCSSWINCPKRKRKSY